MADSTRAFLKSLARKTLPDNLRSRLYDRLEASRIAATLLTRLPSHTRLDGGRFFTDVGPPDPRMRLSLWSGVHESAERSLVRRHLLLGVPVVELGAGIGVVSHAAWIAGARASPSRPRMLVVEANPAVAATLRRNLAANQVMADVVEAAVAYGQDQVMLNISNGHWVAAGVRPRGNSEGPSRLRSEQIPVPTVTLSELCDRVLPGNYPLQLISDIEGAEWEVFEHDGRLLFERFSVIVAELHGGDRADGSDVICRASELLEPLGFRLVEAIGGSVAFTRPD